MNIDGRETLETSSAKQACTVVPRVIVPSSISTTKPAVLTQHWCEVETTFYKSRRLFTNSEPRAGTHSSDDILLMKSPALVWGGITTTKLQIIIDGEFGVGRELLQDRHWGCLWYRLQFTELINNLYVRKLNETNVHLFYLSIACSKL